MVGQMSGRTNVGRTNVGRTNVGRTKLAAPKIKGSFLNHEPLNDQIRNLHCVYELFEIAG